MNTDLERALLALVDPDGIDGGIVYADPHVRLSEVMAALDDVPPAGRMRAVILDYLTAYWPVPISKAALMARADSLVARLAREETEG